MLTVHFFSCLSAVGYCPAETWLWQSVHSPTLLHGKVKQGCQPKGTHPCWHGTARSVLRQAWWVCHSSLSALGQRLPSVAWSEPAKPQPGMQTSMASEPGARWWSGGMALRMQQHPTAHCHHNTRSQHPKRHSDPMCRISGILLVSVDTK